MGIIWLLAAWLARNYADTYGFGTDLAEWFAQSGKWLVLLAAMLSGHGWICGARQTPTGILRRFFYYTAVLGIVALVVSHTLPI